MEDNLSIYIFYQDSSMVSNTEYHLFRRNYNLYGSFGIHNGKDSGFGYIGRYVRITGESIYDTGNNGSSYHIEPVS